MAILALIVVFIVLPLAELYVIYLVGDAIGVIPTLLILAADSLLGSLLLRSQGRAVWRRFTDAVAEGRVPHREVLDGVLVIFGGAFLITPGFLTDALGLFFLFPPTRAIARRLVVRAFKGRIAIGMAGAAERRHTRRADDWDVEGTASEGDDSPLDLPAPRR